MKLEETKPDAIVLDLDDCVFSFLGPFLDSFNEYAGEYISLSEIINYDFDKRMSNYLHEIEKVGLYLSLPLEFGAITFINKIKQRGLKVFIVTARPEIYRRDTELALVSKGIEYTNLIFSKQKDIIVNQLTTKYNVVAFIDDRASTVIDVSIKCSVPFTFMINKPHNRKFNLDNTSIIRVSYIMDCWKIIDGFMGSK